MSDPTTASVATKQTGHGNGDGKRRKSRALARRELKGDMMVTSVLCW
jgi:hypothetical protein